MTCINGAWLLLWLLSSPAAAMAYGQAGVGMICTLTPVLFQCSCSHWRMIKYSAGWGLGACRLFTRGFFFPLPPFLFYLTRNVCAFLRAPTWLQQRKRRICVEVCHRLVYNFSGSRLKAKGIQFAHSENHLHAGSTGCAAAYHNQSVWVSWVLSDQPYVCPILLCRPDNPEPSAPQIMEQV